MLVEVKAVLAPSLQELSKAQRRQGPAWAQEPIGGQTAVADLIYRMLLQYLRVLDLVEEWMFEEWM